MKTPELEDQYAIIFGLALWPQEPQEMHSFEKEFVFTKSGRQKITTNVNK